MRAKLRAARASPLSQRARVVSDPGACVVLGTGSANGGGKWKWKEGRGGYNAGLSVNNALTSPHVQSV